MSRHHQQKPGLRHPSQCAWPRHQSTVAGMGIPDFLSGTSPPAFSQPPGSLPGRHAIMPRGSKTVSALKNLQLTAVEIHQRSEPRVICNCQADLQGRASGGFCERSGPRERKTGPTRMRGPWARKEDTCACVEEKQASHNPEQGGIWRTLQIGVKAWTACGEGQIGNKSLDVM